MSSSSAISSSPLDSWYHSAVFPLFSQSFSHIKDLNQSPKASLNSVTQLCLALWDPMDCSTPGLPVHHQLSEFTQTHAHPVSDAIQPSHPLSPPSPLALSVSQHQGLFQLVGSLCQVAKVLELQHQSFK